VKKENVMNDFGAAAFSRRHLLIGAATFAALGVVAPRRSAADIATVGAAAPTFSLTSSTGPTISLADQRGKIVVLEWTNHDCPYVRKHYDAGNMQNLQKEATGQGVVWLTVISSAPGTQGHVSAGQANELTKTRKASPTAVLFDPAGTVGKAYGATNTPHMYVITKDGVLAYAGAIDDKPTTRRSDVESAQSFVRPALAAVAAGQPVKTPVTRAYGCTIKYA
jgi:peroxiredoxin